MDAERAKIRPITAEDAEFADWYEVYRRAHDAEYPNGPAWLEHELAARYRPTPFWDLRLWIAELDGHVVGAAVVTLPMSDNLQRADIEIWVDPKHWRRGIGTALLHEVIDGARDAGRRTLLTFVEGPVALDTTSGTSFAAKHGFAPGLREVASTQRAPFDMATIQDVEAAARLHAVDYRIVQWRDRVPDELIDGYARMYQRMSTDAPSGELDFQEEVWDEERVRASEKRVAEMGRTRFVTAAIAPDGSMAGATDIAALVGHDDAAFQNITIVDPRHRGHRLGLLMKAANVQYLLDARPGIECIWTWNAASNSYMISVNEAIGYRPEGWGEGYQLDLPSR